MPKTPIEMLLYHSQNRPNKACLNQPVNRTLNVTTWREAEMSARTIASGLISLGLKKGDAVAILAKNSAEWFLADWAIMMAGMVSVPIYATAGVDTLRFIIEHSEAKAVFVGKLDDKTAAASVLDGSIPRIAFPYDTVASDHSWSDWLEKHSPLTNIHLAALDEIMSIVYTSGSTGQPKGVVLSYLNYASVCVSHCETIQFSPEDRVVSYLPLAHITERGVIEGPGLYGGATFYFVESLDTFIDDLKIAKPTLFLSVPRLWTRFQMGVLEKLPARKLNRLLSIPILGGLIARKIRKGLGLDSARVVGSGSAPISPSVLEWYGKIGVNIAEGWGMSETTGLSCVNLPFRADYIGSIGKPCDCVEMTLSNEGEIIIRGDAVFNGYFKNPEETDKVFTDGWFHTGDKAVLAENGSIKIIGRMKEEFKTAKGKYVSPVPIESALSSNSDLEQICVMGSGRKQPVAVVVLAPHMASEKREEIRKSIAATLDQVNSTLESHQKLDCVIVTEEVWSIENERLTPTLKIKRAAIEEHYRELIFAADSQSVIWEDEISA